MNNQNNTLIKTSDDVEYYDNFSWLVQYLNIDSWNDKEIEELINNHVLFEVKVMSDLLHKFGKQANLEINDSSDFYGYEDSDEDSDDGLYYEEAYTNYLQYKDLY
jgi:hypothetical protein